MAIKLAELKKMCKKLNKLNLVDEDIDIDQELEELKEDFIETMEEIDDDGKVGKVDKDIIAFYEKTIDEDDEDDEKSSSGKSDDFDRDDLEEELEEMSRKQIKAYIAENDLAIKTKVTKDNLGDVIEEILDAMETKSSGSGSDDDDDGDKDQVFDRDEMEEKLEDMDYKTLKGFVKENEIETETALKKKSFDDDQEDIIEEILDFLEEKAKKADKGKGKKDKGKKDKGKKDKGKKDKGKSKDTGKDGDLPKGMRSGSIPALIYIALRDEKASTIMDIAKIIGKAKKKDADKCINGAVRIIAKSVAKNAKVQITYDKSTDLSDGKVELVD